MDNTKPKKSAAAPQPKPQPTTAYTFPPVTNRTLLWIGLGVLALMVVIFRSVLGGDILFTTDDGIGSLAIRKRVLPDGISGWWLDDVLLGFDAGLAVNWTNFLMWLLPLEAFVNWNHAIDLGLASIFLALFLRNRGVALPAIALGIITAFWVGNNLTLTYAGHIGKYGALIFAAAYLWLSDLAVRRKSWAHAVLAGGCLGMMLLEQADVALFCAIFLGPYTLVTCWQAHPKNFGVLVKLLAPLCVVAGLVAIHGVLANYRGNVKDVAVVKQESAQAKWEFSTQWSWPPEESVDFIAPGYMGWRSHEPKGPYWGRMGRSATWSVQQPNNGFMNFKLENHYMGVIPVALALWAICLFWSKRTTDADRRRQLLIWLVITAGTLVLSFGKYVPVYRVLHALPGFSSIRNPNKFMHLFQIGLAILAAYGLDDVLRSPKSAKRLSLVLLGLGGILVLWSVGVSSKAPDIIAQYAAQMSGAAVDVIAKNKGIAAAHAAVLALLFGTYLLLQAKKFRPALCWIPIGLMAVDATLLADRYISAQNKSTIAANLVVQHLKQQTDGSRVALTSQDSFYNYWLTYLFPYHQISAFNITQMPRMPADYQQYLGAFGQNPLRLWQASAVKTIVTPAQFLPQIQANPQWRDQFTKIMDFNVAQGPGGQPVYFPGTPEQPGQHAVIQFKNPAPRFHLFGKWREGTDDEALARLRGTDPLLAETIVATGSGVKPASSGATSEPAGEVKIVSYQPGLVKLSVNATQPAILRAADRYVPGWQATIDGQPAPVVRCDFIMQGIAIEPGQHEVVLRFVSKSPTLYVQFAGMALCALALLAVLAQSFRKPAAA